MAGYSGTRRERGQCPSRTSPTARIWSARSGVVTQVMPFLSLSPEYAYIEQKPEKASPTPPSPRGGVGEVGEVGMKPQNFYHSPREAASQEGRDFRNLSHFSHLSHPTDPGATPA